MSSNARLREAIEAGFDLRMLLTNGNAERALRETLDEVCAALDESGGDGSGLDVERLMDAEHRWCVQVEGDFALRHDVEAHRKQAEFIGAALRGDSPDLDVERARKVIEIIRDAHDRDPDGGMGYRGDGSYGRYENACLVCGVSGEYAVEWPCLTRQRADDARAALSTPSPARDPEQEG